MTNSTTRCSLQCETGALLLRDVDTLADVVDALALRLRLDGGQLHKAQESAPAVLLANRAHNAAVSSAQLFSATATLNLVQSIAAVVHRIAYGLFFDALEAVAGAAAQT